MSISAVTGRVVIAGGSGFLGMSLARHLTSRHADCEVVVLSRKQSASQSADDRIRSVQWDARSVGDWAQELDGCAGVVNLAGRSVDCIKSADHCDEILRSRVEATRALGRALRQINHQPPVWVQMSTAHIYGDPGKDVPADEDAAFGYGLAPYVGMQWEQAHTDAMQHLGEMRSVILRTTFVLGRNGGALPRLQKLVRWGLGGTVGSGVQGMSWIHERDLNRLFERALADSSMTGAYIATAPNPVSNREFMQAMRRALRQPIGLPAFEWMVRIGAPLVMRTDPELALYGRYCVSKRLREEGFECEFTEIEAALRGLYQ